MLHFEEVTLLSVLHNYLLIFAPQFKLKSIEKPTFSVLFDTQWKSVENFHIEEYSTWNVNDNKVLWIKTKWKIYYYYDDYFSKMRPNCLRNWEFQWKKMKKVWRQLNNVIISNTFCTILHHIDGVKKNRFEWVAVIYGTWEWILSAEIRILIASSGFFFFLYSVLMIYFMFCVCRSKEFPL